MKKYFVSLVKEKRELKLLEWVYFAVTVVFVVLAGLVALLNQPLGVALLVVPLASFTAFALNLVVWSVLKTVIDNFTKKK